MGGALPLALFAVPMGCVVTDTIQIEPVPNSPPALYQPAGLGPDQPSFESIYVIDLDSTPFSQLELRAFVRDADVDQDLEWQLFLDFDSLDPTPNPAIDGDALEAFGSEVRADLDGAPIPVLVSQLGGPGCHKLELRVSSDWVPAFPRYLPRDPEDLAVMVFWVAVTDAANPIVDMATCL